MPTVALTGASGLLGSAVIRALQESSDAPQIVGIDLRIPDPRPRDVDWRVADIRDADAMKAALEGADVLVHAAFQLDELDDLDEMRSINIDGTRTVFEAAAATGVGRAVQISSATVYGAHADNELPLTEESPLRADAGLAYAGHKRELEEWLGGWQQLHPDIALTILRPAIIVGPAVDNFIVRALRGPRVIWIRGHRTPMQVVHVDDVAAAVVHAIDHDLPGAYNVAAEGWLSRAELDLILDRRVVELPEEVAWTALDRAHRMGLSEVDTGILPYVMHPWVLSVDRLVATGWRPVHTNRDALSELVQEQRDRIVVGPIETSRQAVKRAVGGTVAGTAGVMALGILARRRRSRDA